MKIILHGRLRDQYGPEFEFNTNVVSDAIEGLSRQLPNWDRNMVLEAVGFDTEGLLRSPTDAEEVHLVPIMHGGGGKFTNIIIGIAIMAVVVVATGGIGATVAAIQAGTLSALSSSFLVAGAMMVVTGVIGLFMKAPTLSKSKDPAASKYLGINQNTTGFGTPIPLAWGRVKLRGHYLSIQSDASGLIAGSFPTNPT